MIKKTCQIVMIVNKAGCMSSYMDKVNERIHQILEEVKILQEETGIDFQVSIMEFSTGAKWLIYRESLAGLDVCLENFCHGLRNYGEAFYLLNKHLNRNDLMKQEGALARPYFFFFTHGEDVLEADAVSQLEQLRRNPWFYNGERAIVYAANCEKEAVHSVYESFVDSIDGCLGVDEPIKLNYVKLGAFNFFEN